jgi:hypothetical protein
MFGKKNTTDGLTYNFNTNGKLEIQLKTKNRMGDKTKTKWMPATPNVFRSFHGKRRVNGVNFKGQVFCFMTNAKYGIDAFMDGYKTAPVKSRIPEKKPLSIQIVKKGNSNGYTMAAITDFSTGKTTVKFRPFGK